MVVSGPGLAPAPPAPAAGGLPHARPRRRLRHRSSAPQVLRARLARRLARLPVFAGCDRRQLRRAVRWGELLEVPAGQTLVRQGCRDYWFFVVLAGRVRLTRSGRQVATVGPGSHFGEGAIVGFRPQAATATTAEPSVFFVLGPRFLLSLLSTSPGFQLALFPDVAAADFAAYAQRMLAEGGLEWRRLAPPPPWTPPARRGRPRPPSARRAGTPPLPSAPSSGRPPGRPMSLREAVAVLSHSPVLGDLPLPAPGPPARPAVRIGSVTAAVAVLAVVLFGYHPPVGVVSAGRPIDVLGDIHVTGAPVHRPTGRYLLLWVRETRPDLAGALVSFVTGQPTLGVGSGPAAGLTPAEVERLGRAQYLDSRATAARAAVLALGLDPRSVSVSIRDRGLSGPSAGLVYALAVSDLLGGRDLARGRTVAATGQLEADGTVDPVGWVTLKSAGAAAGGADVLLVPEGEQGDTGGWPGRVDGVSDLRQAWAILEKG